MGKGIGGMEHVNPRTRLRKSTDAVLQHDNVPAPYGRQKVLHAYTENPYPSGSFRTSVEDSQLAWLPKAQVLCWLVPSAAVWVSTQIQQIPVRRPWCRCQPPSPRFRVAVLNDSKDPEVLETCINKPSYLPSGKLT